MRKTNVDIQNIAKEKRKSDEWYTPKEPISMIVPFLKQKGFRNILCPFDTSESNFVKVLSEQGFNVAFSHIKTGTDFFDINDYSGYDVVISNPPYSKRDAVLERLFNVDIPFAMIFNINGIFDNTKRWNMFKNNKFEILVPKGRIKFFNEHHDGGGILFQSVYVCHNILDNQIEFAEMKKSDNQISLDDLLDYGAK